MRIVNISNDWSFDNEMSSSKAEALKLVKRKSGLSWVRTILGTESREGDGWRYSPTSTRREEFEDEIELETHC